jgi:hypothetical protein
MGGGVKREVYLRQGNHGINCDEYSCKLLAKFEIVSEKCAYLSVSPPMLGDAKVPTRSDEAIATALMPIFANTLMVLVLVDALLVP